MTSVLIIAGHVGIRTITAAGLRPCRLWQELAGGTGTTGEQAWTGNAAPLLADALRVRGVDAVVVNAIYDKALYDREWDLVLALHLQRDRASARAFASVPNDVGVCDGAPYISAAARAKAQRWVDRFHNEYPVVSGIPTTPDAVTDRMTGLYNWDYPTLESPCAIAELGHADIDAPVLYEPGIARVIRALALVTCEYLEADLGAALTPLTLPPAAAEVEPFPLSTFTVAGIWDHDPAALESAITDYAQGAVPPSFGVMLAEIARQANVRADVAAAQVMHETGRFRFDGTDSVFSAKSDWFNYGGIKTTDSSATAHFTTVVDGLRALCAHISWYANPDHTAPWCNQATDPRHFGAHKNNLHTLADFGGGVWNTSERPQYGAAIARHLAEIRSRIAAYVSPAAPPIDKLVIAKRLAAEIVSL